MVSYNPVNNPRQWAAVSTVAVVIIASRFSSIQRVTKLGSNGFLIVIKLKTSSRVQKRSSEVYNIESYCPTWRHRRVLQSRSTRGRGKKGILFWRNRIECRKIPDFFLKEFGLSWLFFDPEFSWIFPTLLAWVKNKINLI